MNIRTAAAVILAAAVAACGQLLGAGGGLQPGQPVNGTLEVSETKSDQNNAVADTFQLNGRQGEQYTLTLTSEAFDAYLYVRGPGSLSQDNDDDGSGSYNSRLNITFPENGVAQVYVTSFSRNAVGAYQLLVERTGEATPNVANNTTPGQAPPIAAQQLAGELAPGDQQLGSGEYLDTFPLQGVAGQQVEITLSSQQFDTYVAISGPGGFQQYNDDDTENNTRNSRLVATLPANGEYTVHVTSYAAGETGAYQLNVAPTSTTTASGALAGGDAQSFTAGQTMNGELAQGDTTLNSGEFIDTFSFQGQAGQRVTIDMRSTAVDPYLILLAPSGAQEDNDDASSSDRNARIETTLAESGQYRIGATSYQPGERGAYVVTLQQGAAPQVSANNSARRVFAVMVGISDYPGSGNDLPLTAEDARKLQQALARQGTLAPESVTLIDAQATRAGLRQAFQRVAAAAGPDDLFLFFYSGHGNQVRGQVSATEPDGKDETIEMVDGSITDDELNQLFQQVRAQTSLLVLDSCFSGGFARDVVSRPGVMGLFSSEEDLTSSVAEKFQAGGFLSHFIQTGLEGGADENRDRVITAGELGAYVRREFAREERIAASTQEGQSNYQFPVVERGAVQVDAPILGLGRT
ncbi:pre-peptidase C-terminal domain-containing protein [Candidatus Viadribacter manganicus]|nr:pre-peptidase C-terminal domain-containing protein [Candidatus Viadribacter manganicus]